MKFENMRVSSRLRICFSSLFFALAMVSWLAISNLNAANNQTNTLLYDQMLKVRMLHEFKDNLNNITLIVRNLALSIDTKAAAAEADKIPAIHRRNQEILGELTKIIKLPKGVELLNAIKAQSADHRYLLEETIKLSLTGKRTDQQAATRIIVGEQSACQSALSQAVDASIAFQQQLAEDTAQSTTHLLTSSAIQILTCTAAASVLGLGLAWWTSRSITHQLGAEPFELEGVAEKITKIQERSSALEELSRTDQLTGLLNRHGMAERLRRAWQRSCYDGSRFGLLWLDLDLFKLINDKHGHAAGDAALRSVANAIKENIRIVDAAARWGGDEFLVLLEQISQEELNDIAERIRSSVQHCPHPCPLSVSVGGHLMLAQESLDQILDQADGALYSAKEAGRNCYRYSHH